MAAMTDHDVIVAELADLLASPLDPVLSDPTRLRIQAALHALPDAAAMSFTILRKALMLTDGNLGKHVHVLMDAGFVETEEHWRGKRRTTLYPGHQRGPGRLRRARPGPERHHQGLFRIGRPRLGGSAVSADPAWTRSAMIVDRYCPRSEVAAHDKLIMIRSGDVRDEWDAWGRRAGPPPSQRRSERPRDRLAGSQGGETRVPPP